MRKIESLEDLRSSKTLIGYFGGLTLEDVLQDGNMLLVFETKEALIDYCISHNLPPCRFIEAMYFEEMLEGMGLGGHYGLTKAVCRIFDKEWRSRIGPSPISPSTYALVTDFYRISGR